SLERHQTAERLEDRIEARTIAVRSRRAESRDRRIDEARVDGAQALVADAEPLGDARAHVLHDDVGALGQTVDDPAPLGGLQIDRDRALAAIPAEEAGQLGERVPLDAPDP